MTVQSLQFKVGPGGCRRHVTSDIRRHHVTGRAMVVDGFRSRAGDRDSCNRDTRIRRSHTGAVARAQPPVGDRTLAKTRRCGVSLQRSARGARRRLRWRSCRPDNDCGLLFANCTRVIRTASCLSGGCAHSGEPGFADGARFHQRIRCSRSCVCVFFRRFGLPTEAAVALSLVSTGMVMGLSLVGGVFFLKRR
jgi:hypothetical protein